MALKGHRRQGYCVLTVTTAADGTQTETLGTGVITSHVVSFTGSHSGDTSDLWAGDTKDYSDPSAEGSVQFVLSDLSIEDEAAFGGHTLDTATKKMTVADSDVSPYVRYAAMGTGTKTDDSTGKKETFYRVVEYYRVQMTDVDDNFATKAGNSTTWQTHSVSGSCFYNCDGKMISKQDFTTFDAALSEMKTFLNIT